MGFLGVNMELFLIAIPLLVCLFLWLSESKIYIHTVNAVGTFLLMLASFTTAKIVIDNHSIAPEYFNNLFYIDAFSALLLVITCVISFLISIYSIGYLNEEFRHKIITLRKMKIYYTLLNIFILTMIIVLTTQNMGLMWIAIEATTLASAFLVGFYNNRKSLEAAWKYIIVCSVGIAFALLGIILLYYSSIQSLGQSVFGLNWQFLNENADRLQGSILKIAFIFILAGFGTKVGLAPMHTWLPDAHSQAPSPVSALLSGVLLNTAMYGIVRVMIVVNKNLKSNEYTGRLLIILGVISIGTAAIFVMVQSDYKRMLAYSSIEHMGLITLGFGVLSPLSVFASLYHIFNHAFTKSMLFVASGNIYLKYETKRINKVKGILKIMPVTGVIFLLGIFAIAGMPPFSIFSSELSIIVSLFGKYHFLAAGLIMLFLIFIFAGFVIQLIKMFNGKPANREIKKGEIDYFGPVVLIIFLIIISTTGFYLPAPLKALLDSAGLIITGGVK